MDAQTWSAIGAMIAAIAACFYTFYTYHLLKSTKTSIDKTNKLAEFEIYMRIGEKLSSKEAVDLIHACSNRNVIIDGDARDLANNAAANISGHTFRSILLNPIEDLSKFFEDGLISIETIDSGFGFLILQIGNCQAALDHIIYLRTNVYDSDNVYKGFEDLYLALWSKCTVSEKAKFRCNWDSPDPLNHLNNA